MFGKIRRIISLFNTISITKTIYLNYKVFPWNIAKKLPIYVGKNVDINEVYKGCIEIQKDLEIKRGMVRFGICPIRFRTRILLHFSAYLLRPS